MNGAFLFGKLPSHGDFVARGLSADERDSLDQWLSTELAEARAALADSFEDRFDSAPPWRFAWDGEEWTAGACASSVDSVGRRFPLLVARTGLGTMSVEPAAEACEQAIYDAFEQGWTADELAAAVAALEPTADSEGMPVAGWWTLGSEEFEPHTLAGIRPAGLIAAMLGKPTRAAA